MAEVERGWMDPDAMWAARLAPEELNWSSSTSSSSSVPILSPPESIHSIPSSSSGYCEFSWSSEFSDEIDELPPAPSGPNFPPKFNLMEFAVYQQYQELLFAGERLESIRHGVNSVNFMQAMKYRDEFILDEMFKTYGKMDTQDEYFKTLFRVYKERFLEMIARIKEKELAYLTLIVGEGEDIIAPSFDMTTLVKSAIQTRFSQEDLEVFQNMDPRRNKWGVDWLNVPRPKRVKKFTKRAKKKNKGQSGHSKEENKSTVEEVTPEVVAVEEATDDNFERTLEEPMSMGKWMANARNRMTPSDLPNSETSPEHSR